MVVLSVRPVFVADGISLADVACRHDRGRGEVEPAPARMLVLVRRGGRDCVTGYFRNACFSPITTRGTMLGS